MKEKEFIAVNEFCQYHSIEVSFIHSLEDSGLIEVSTIEETTVIPYEEMPRIERFIRMHYDLDINVAGLETIDYLLQKIEALQEQVRRGDYRRENLSA